VANVGHDEVMAVHAGANVGLGAVLLGEVGLRVQDHAVLAQAGDGGGDDVAVWVELEGQAGGLVGGLWVLDRLS
jgi:hypothetical protein